MADKEIFVRRLFGLFFLIQCFMNVKFVHSSSVVHFEALENIEDRISAVRHRVRRDLTGDGDAKCKKEESDFLLELKNGKKIDKVYTFQNETRYAMALAWAGENDGTLIVVTTETRIDGSAASSNVYRSTNYGETFTDISSKVQNLPIRKHAGLQRHPTDAKRLYMIYESRTSSKVFVTVNGGDTFHGYELPFSGGALDEELIFNTANTDYLLARTDKKELFLSKDNGQTWKNIIGHAHTAEWGIIDDDSVDTAGDSAGTIYVTIGNKEPEDPILSHFFLIGDVPVYTLKRTDDLGVSWRTLLEGVVKFKRAGRFLSATVLQDPNDHFGLRLMKISIDGGKTWREAQLPTIEEDRFYSVLDMEEDLIFMHVDNPEDTGHGILYTSSINGIVYSESLDKHLFPNFGEIHDFYKVKSMRGVYITSQMSDDDSIHSMITYNRGATWQKIPRPEGAPCKDEAKECFLQLHGLYSLKRGIKAGVPMSEANAPGIILAHGHVADALQTTDPDVYVSSDGGYTWRLSLKGPHHYQIGDHGGLLVAVPFSTNQPKIVKFSTDEGRCWHEYKFTDDAVNNTGLLTEPGGKSSVVGIWGYTNSTRKWRTHVINFQTVIPDACKASDYETWMPHQQQRKNEGTEFQGCLLGLKETFQRIKKDSWCYNGYEKEIKNAKTTCTCSREDYECMYGYYRPGASDSCVKNPKFKGPEVDICLMGHIEKIITDGYRKIPGDSCENGFKPEGKMIDLEKQCIEGDKSVVKNDEKAKVVNHAKKVAVIMVVTVVLLLAGVVAVYFVRKYAFLKRHKVEYKYSLLNQSDRENDLDNDLENAISPKPSMLYQDSDEEELTTSSHPKSHQNGSVTKDTKRQSKSVAFKSYHDDSDDDLLS